MAEPRVTPASSATRLLFTLLAPLVVFAARRLPLPGAGVDAAHVPEVGREFLAGKLSPVALGLAPFVAATLIVELVAAAVPRLRPLRTSGPSGRQKLARVSAIVFVFVAALQGVGLTQTLSTVIEGVDVPRVVMTLVAGSAALLILASFVGRRGLAHGVLVVLASDAIAATVDDALAHSRGLRLPPVPVIAGGAIAAMLVTAFTMRGAERRREATVRPPIAGVWPVRLGAGALGAAATMSSRLGGPLHRWLADTTGYVAGWILLTAVFTIALVPLVADASFLAPLGARASGGDAPPEGAEASAKKAVSDALSPSLTFMFLLVLVGEVVAALASYSLDLFGLALAAALALDVAAEIRARRRLGELVAVWSEVRPYAIGPAARALAAAGVDFHVRDERQRLLLTVLGPFGPSDVLVRPGDARRAAEVLAEVLPPRAPSKDDAPEDKARIEEETKASSGAAVGAAIAIVVTLFVYRITPMLPAPVLVGLAIDPAARVELGILSVDDDVDPFGAPGELPRGVRIRAEQVPNGSAKVETRHYAVIVPMNEAGDDVDRTLAAAEPFFAKIPLPPGDRLVFGALHDDAERGSKTGALRTWVVRGEPSVATSKDVARVASIPAKLEGKAALALELAPDAAVRLRELTARSIARRIAIVIDGRVETAPIVMGEIADGYLQITPGTGDSAADEREIERLSRGLAPP